MYVLSYYKQAREDKRFLEALQGKIVDKQIVIERISKNLAELSFCRKGQTSVLATKRYLEIIENMKVV